MTLAALGFERRLETPRWLLIVTPVLAGIVALALSAIVLAATGHNPVTAYQRMVEASITRSGALSATLITATPLLLTGLAAAVAFRMKAWNIGGEGQLYLGAICAAAAGLLVGDRGLGVALPVMCLAGIAGGAMWAAIPGLLRAYMNTNEILTSLMLNYLGALLMYYLIFDSNSYWRDLTTPGAQVFPTGKQIAEAAWWPGFITGDVIAPLGFVLGLICAVGLFVAIRSTRFGFHLRLTSDSPRAAQYAGVRTRRMFVLVMVLSGSLAGLAGASQVGDFTHALDPKGLQEASYGYTGIVVAALARYNTLGVILAALFMGALANAGMSLAGSEFPRGLVGTMEGIILFCVLGGELLTRYRFRPDLLRGRGGAAAGPDAGAPDDAPPQPELAQPASTRTVTDSPPEVTP